MSMKPLLIAMSLLLTAISSLAHGDLIRSRAMAEMQINGGQPTEAELGQAVFIAKEKSVQRYLTEFRPGAAKVYANCRLTEDNIDKVIVETRTRPVKVRDGQLKLKMSTAINQVKLDSHLQNCVQPTAKRIAIVLVARQRAGSGKKATYQAFFGQLDKALGEVLVSRGFEVDSKQDMEIYSGGLYRQERLVRQFEHRGQVNWEPARIAGFLTDIDLMVIGYFQVDAPRRVKLNNMISVSVSGSAEMFHLTDNRVVAATDKIQLSAEAPSAEQAVNEAAQLVVEEAGIQLADKLSAFVMQVRGK
ncbi:MAG: hypothetical protein SV765_08930 [Pseudomonadota bacterium]|nr:hypothetical protein [Pseudomonadota bacterium]